MMVEIRLPRFLIIKIFDYLYYSYGHEKGTITTTRFGIGKLLSLLCREFRDILARRYKIINNISTKIDFEILRNRGLDNFTDIVIFSNSVLREVQNSKEIYPFVTGVDLIGFENFDISNFTGPQSRLNHLALHDTPIDSLNSVISQLLSIQLKETENEVAVLPQLSKLEFGVRPKHSVLDIQSIANAFRNSPLTQFRCYSGVSWVNMESLMIFNQLNRLSISNGYICANVLSAVVTKLRSLTEIDMYKVNFEQSKNHDLDKGLDIFLQDGISKTETLLYWRLVGTEKLVSLNTLTSSLSSNKSIESIIIFNVFFTKTDGENITINNQIIRNFYSSSNSVMDDQKKNTNVKFNLGSLWFSPSNIKRLYIQGIKIDKNIEEYHNKLYYVNGIETVELISLLQLSLPNLKKVSTISRYFYEPSELYEKLLELLLKHPLTKLEFEGAYPKSLVIQLIQSNHPNIKQLYIHNVQEVLPERDLFEALLQNNTISKFRYFIHTSKKFTYNCEDWAKLICQLVNLKNLHSLSITFPITLVDQKTISPEKLKELQQQVKQILIDNLDHLYHLYLSGQRRMVLRDLINKLFLEKNKHLKVFRGFV
ncbi:hypothetical protein DLAC_01727 [Tieghemostelium lacteum]|uniref:Uncharacterized protein n=1 Tax=Tieghemostelium lacteum TaxID=361077 RepID=A0A152A6M6_TIELA|nr:hypothetical protein DLAC_01727 [Tieghemostelium lacteum]|eukprot:KYR01717.1 hypothetical protein DLAC_01727 [Tieghemostelium lacteum]